MADHPPDSVHPYLRLAERLDRIAALADELAGAAHSLVILHRHAEPRAADTHAVRLLRALICARAVEITGCIGPEARLFAESAQASGERLQ